MRLQAELGVPLELPVSSPRPPKGEEMCAGRVASRPSEMGCVDRGSQQPGGEWGTPSVGWMLYMRVFEPGSPAWLLALGWPEVEASRQGSGCGQSVPTVAPGGQLWYCMAGPRAVLATRHVAGVWALVVTLQASGKEERQGGAALQSWALPPALEWTGRLLVEPPPCCWAGGSGSFPLGREEPRCWRRREQGTGFAGEDPAGLGERTAFVFGAITGL